MWPTISQHQGERRSGVRDKQFLRPAQDSAEIDRGAVLRHAQDAWIREAVYRRAEDVEVEVP